MTDKLYIIGNGFDLHHGLRTLYANFRDDYVKKKSPVLWNDLLEIYGNAPQDDDLWWKDFENMLGMVDYGNLSKSNNGEALGFMKVRNLMKGKLPPLFGKWIKGIDSQIDTDKIKLIDEIDADSLFFTFNYTMLLENAYKVKEEFVWHIHESVKHPDDIVVGHDSNAGQLVKYAQEYNKDQLRISPLSADQINQEVLNGAKKVKDKIYEHDLSHKFDQYNDIKHFVVMGFSFNNIDIPNIKRIIDVNRNIADADWTLYVHSSKDRTAIDKLHSLGIDLNKIEIKNW